MYSQRMLKQPLQALLIAPINQMHAMVEGGNKTISIREGHRAYEVGKPLAICCHIKSWCVMAKVTEVIHSTLIEVSDEDLAADGFDSHTEAMAALHEFYPSLSLDSAVTVLKWTLA